SFRRLLKVALRRFGLRAIDARELQPNAQTREVPMSAFSERVRAQRDKGLFKVADFPDGKEMTLTISHLLEEVVMFEKELDLLCFVETGRQLQLNQTTSEWLLDNLGDDPETYPGKRVTLFLGEYEYNKKKVPGIHLKLPGSGDGAVALPPRKLKPVAPEFDDEIPPY